MCVTTTVLVCLLGGAQALTPSRPMTLDEAIQIAVRQNPAVAQAEAKLQEAEAHLKQARSGYYPQIGSSGLAKIGLSGALNALSPQGIANSPFFRNLAEGVTVYHPGLDFGRTKHAVHEQERRVQVFVANVAAAKSAVRLQTIRAFYRLLEARLTRHVTQERVRSREANARQALAFYEARLRSKVDLELARVSLSEAQVKAIEAENRVKAASAELTRDLGTSQQVDPTIVEGDLVSPVLAGLTELLEEAQRNRPEITALATEREAAMEAVQLARSQRKPALSFFFSGGYARFTNVLARQLMVLGAGISLPVFTWGKLEGQAEEAEARLRWVDLQLTALRQDVELETRAAYLRLQNELESIPARQAHVTHAREALQLTQARYRARMAGIIELTQAEAHLAEAKAAEATTTYSAKVAEAELNFAIGRP
jgi:outer membrane protein TolC